MGIEDNLQKNNEAINQTNVIEEMGDDYEVIKDLADELFKDDIKKKNRYTRRGVWLWSNTKNIEQTVEALKQEAIDEQNKVLPEDTKKEFIG
ncbi:MAG: hypothetical protein U9Q85_04810 [Patescibacteria group bacterium]|nr:hypothetical protein [Patescibacteria group bacterium]